jgi:hypothetical protein
MTETTVASLTARAVWESVPLLNVELAKPDKKVKREVVLKLARAMSALRAERRILEDAQAKNNEDHAQRDDEGNVKPDGQGNVATSDPLAFNRAWQAILDQPVTLTLPCLPLGDYSEELSVTALSLLVDLGMVAA